jgi:hypothetical protein
VMAYIHAIRNRAVTQDPRNPMRSHRNLKQGPGLNDTIPIPEGPPPKPAPITNLDSPPEPLREVVWSQWLRTEAFGQEVHGWIIPSWRAQAYQSSRIQDCAFSNVI